MNMTTHDTTYRWFAPSPRGLESLLAEELATLGAVDVRPGAGGVAFGGSLKVGYRANLESRLASRVLCEVANGEYRREDDIYALARDVAWEHWFLPGQTLRVDTTGRGCALKSLDFVTLRVKDAICDRFREAGGTRPSIDTRTPDVRVQVFLTEAACTLYLDASGAPLWQRGLRQKTVEAPLKENLAAGILQLTGWNGETPLFDPMCGSGTFLLEAAQWLCRRVPGRDRSFAFEQWRGFDKRLWADLRESARAAERPLPKGLLFGSDRDARATRATLANLDRAGFLAGAVLSTADFLEAPAPAASGVLVCNLPYGVRLEEQEALADGYPMLGDVLKQRYDGWQAWLLTADARLVKRIGLRTARRIPLYNGPLECRLLHYPLVARRPSPTV